MLFVCFFCLWSLGFISFLMFSLWYQCFKFTDSFLCSNMWSIYELIFQIAEEFCILVLLNGMFSMCLVESVLFTFTVSIWILCRMTCHCWKLRYWSLQLLLYFCCLIFLCPLLLVFASYIYRCFEYRNINTYNCHILLIDWLLYDYFMTCSMY